MKITPAIRADTYWTFITGLSIFLALSHLNVKIIQWDRYSGFIDFTNEESKLPKS